MNRPTLPYMCVCEFIGYGDEEPCYRTLHLQEKVLLYGREQRQKQNISNTPKTMHCQ